MQPSIKQINTTLSDEQKIQIHNIDEEKSKVVYNSIINRYKLERIVPMLYNSNIGTNLLGYKDKTTIERFLKSKSFERTKTISTNTNI